MSVRFWRRMMSLDRVEGEIGVDRVRAVAGEQGEVVDLAGFAGFEDEADRVRVPWRMRWWCRPATASSAGMAAWFSVDAAVGENEDVDAVGDRLGRRR